MQPIPFSPRIVKQASGWDGSLCSACHTTHAPRHSVRSIDSRPDRGEILRDREEEMVGKRERNREKEKERKMRGERNRERRNREEYVETQRGPQRAREQGTEGVPFAGGSKNTYSGAFR